MIFMFPEFHELMYPLECRPVHFYKEKNIHSSALGKPKDHNTIEYMVIMSVNKVIACGASLIKFSIYDFRVE